MRRQLLVAVVAFISTVPFVADVAVNIVTPAIAQQQTVTPDTKTAAVPDQATAQAIIRGQLEALKQDDGNTAYSYAAPNIKQIFPTSDQFMNMVKNAYSPVYHPRSYRFGSLDNVGGRWVQTVELVGPEGDYWTAAYSIEQQADGSWKITGCMLVKAEGTSA